MSNRITYKLKIGKCHKTIIERFSYVGQKHLLSKDKQMPQKYHSSNLLHIKYNCLPPKDRKMHKIREVLHMSNRITYSLEIGRYHKTITKKSC
jgi:hypothetical protein